MDQQIKTRFHNGILQQAIERYGIAEDEIQPLDAFESFVYEFQRGPESYILRINHTLRKSANLIRGEVDWINYLARNKVSAAHAIPSAQGNLVEPIEDGQGGEFLATAFVKAQGQPPWNIWTPALYEPYGELLGHMHALAETYEPANPEWRRPEWDDPIFDFVAGYLPPSEHVAKEKYKEVCAFLRTFATDKSFYGLIHQDAHGANFLVDDAGRITLYDFDDCCYSWFANDIAIVLFYIVQDAADWAEFTREFMTHFLRGYRRVRDLDAKSLKEIPYFLKLREIELYAVIYRDFPLGNIDNAWLARFMEGRKRKIEQGLPFVEFDFATLAAPLNNK